MQVGLKEQLFTGVMELSEAEFTDSADISTFACQFFQVFSRISGGIVVGFIFNKNKNRDILSPKHIQRYTPIYHTMYCLYVENTNTQDQRFAGLFCAQ